MSNPSARLAIGIATRGRPAILCESLEELNTQVRQPDAILVTYADRSDIGEAPGRFPHVRFVQSAPGLTTQRNTILDDLKHFDFVTFLDDDFWLAPDYLSIVENVLLNNPTIAVVTGTVLADGINGLGLELPQAHAILNAAPRFPFPPSSAPSSASSSAPVTFNPVFNAYGCNMTFRLQPIQKHHLRFDEQLPLYGWYEDVDFSRQVAAFGDVIKIDQAYGVHLGVKSGRQSGLRLGYSQVANPVYLARKGSVGWPYAIASMTSRSAKNLVFSLRPEPMIDRRGRLMGNVQAWSDLVQGTLHPTRILGF